MIGKLLVGSIKYVGKFLSSNAGKQSIAAGTIIGVGLAGNGVRQAVSAKKKSKTAYAIQEEALEKHANKRNQTYKKIAELGNEEKKSIELIEYFMSLSEKINKCPSMNEIDSKIQLPSFTPVELKKMSIGLDMALAGTGGGVAGALPGLVFCGASLSTLGFAALGSGIVLSIKGSKLSKQAVANIKQAKKLADDVNNVVEFYNQVDRASIKLTEAIKNVNDIYKKRLGNLAILVQRNNDYETYTENEIILVKNSFKIAILLANMCKTKIANRVKEVEHVNTEEIEFIVEKADKTVKETKRLIFEKVFA